MSARICTDCSSPYLAPVGKEFSCEVCGWIGTPNSGLERQSKELAQENGRRLALVKAGKLFTIRLLCTKEQELKAAEMLTVLFHSTRTDTKAANGEIEQRITTTTKPTKEQLTLLKKMGRVSVFPS